jgi:aconitate hydratase
MPINDPLPETLRLKVSAVRGDNITTDDIIPANAQFSALRSNIPEISKITFGRMDPEFAQRCRDWGPSAIVGGENYGQGSSREHAAIAPMYLGVKLVLAKSMARIHKNNLINHGVVPLIFNNPGDLAQIKQGDELVIENPAAQLKTRQVTVHNRTTGRDIPALAELTGREVDILIAGGQLRMVHSRQVL